MDTRVKILSAVLLALTLCSCKGGGFSHMNFESPFEATKEEKGEARGWDQFYGRKGLDRESKDWKDFYKAPNQDETKPAYCGFWGNCASEDSAAPANCNFYGNCPKEKSGGLGW